MISLVYTKRCNAAQLQDEVRAAGIQAHVSSSFDITNVVSLLPMNQTQKDAITAIVAGHVPDTSFVEETVPLP